MCGFLAYGFGGIISKMCLSIINKCMYSIFLLPGLFFLPFLLSFLDRFLALCFFYIYFYGKGYTAA